MVMTSHKEINDSGGQDENSLLSMHLYAFAN